MPHPRSVTPAGETVQVIRGQQSHFNVSTGFDALVFGVMGALVGVIYVCTLLVAAALIASRTADRAVTWAVRLGLSIAVAGLSVGFLMLMPTAAQSAHTGAATLRGAHSVGVPDGGPGLPLLGWSTTGGDLRVAHFLGMHALQALPLIAIALTLIPHAARLSERIRVRIVFLAAFAYAGVVALTLWQALRGQSLVAPDSVTLVAVAVLIAVGGLGAAAIIHTTRRRPQLSPA